MRFNLPRMRTVRAGRQVVLPPADQRWMHTPTDEEVQRAIRSVPTHYTGVTVNGSVGTKQYGGTSSTSKSYTGITVSAGSNLALIITLNFSGNNLDPSGITAVWDSGASNQSMTSLVSKNYTANTPHSLSAIFGLRNPATGNKTLLISWTNAAEVFACAICFAGVNQTSDGAAFPHTAGFNIVTGPGQMSLTSAVGNMCVGCECASGAFGTSTGTLLYSDNTTGNFVNAIAQYDNGAATVTIGASGSGYTSGAAVDIGATAANTPPWWAYASQSVVQ